MGAGAFIMAEMTNIPYLEIIKVAAIPGILFYVAVGVMVYFESRKLGLRGLSKDELPHFGAVMRSGWFLFLPIVVLMGMLIAGYSPGTSAVYGIVSAIALSWTSSETRMGPRRVWQALVDAWQSEPLRGGADRRGRRAHRRLVAHRHRHKFPYILLELGGKNLPLTLLLLAVATLVLGLPLPITATYLMVAVVAVPALAELGVPLLECASNHSLA